MTLMTFLGYITIGLIIGWLSRLVTKDRGVTMWPSLGFGVLGAIAGTLIVQFLCCRGSHWCFVYRKRISPGRTDLYQYKNHINFTICGTNFRVWD